MKAAGWGRRAPAWLAWALLAAVLGGCGGSTASHDGGNGESPVPPAATRLHPVHLMDSIDVVAFEFDLVEDVTGYEFEWRVAGEAWRSLRTISAPSTRVSATGQIVMALGSLPVHTRIEFRGRSVRDTDRSAWSDVVDFERPRMIAWNATEKYGTGGTVSLRFEAAVSAMSPTPPDVDLYVGGTFRVHLGTPPWAPWVWDTTTSPEGDYLFELRTVAADPAPETWQVGGIRVSRAAMVVWGGVLHDYRIVPSGPGTVSLAPSIYYEFEDTPAPAWATIWAGPIRVADLGPPPWTPVAWSTVDVPEGDYPVRIEIANSSARLDSNGLSSWEPGLVRVDHVPPTVTCTPPAMGRATGWTEGAIALVSNEPTVLRSATITVNGASQPATLRDVEPYRRWALEMAHPHPGPPFDANVAVSGFDPAGNAAILDCPFHAPVWLAPWGEGAVTAGGDTVLGGAFALRGVSTRDASYVSTLLGTLAWAPAAGSSGAGRLRVSSDAGSGFLAPTALGGEGTASSISVGTWRDVVGNGRRWVSWAEQPPAGPSQVWIARDDPSWTREAAPLGRTDRSGVEPAMQVDPGSIEVAVAWSEEDGAGGWLIRGKVRDASGWRDVPGALPRESTSSQRSPALSLNPWGSPYAVPSLDVAYLEDRPGQPSQVRAAYAMLGGPWTPVAGFGNAEPLVGALDPSVSLQQEVVVAWTEAGQVLARMTNRYLGSGEFLTPSVLNRNASSTARSPRVVPGPGAPRAALTVFFVEAGPSGDEIWARRWNGSSWDLLPGPVNEGVGGAVVELEVAPMVGAAGATVSWTDESGRVFIRVENL